MTNRVVNATHISCKTSDISNIVSGDSGNGTIILSIDGSDYVYSNDDVQLSYVMPIFGGLFRRIGIDQQEHLLQGLVHAEICVYYPSMQ